MTVPTDRHREIATKIAIRAGRGADEQYVGSAISPRGSRLSVRRSVSAIAVICGFSRRR
jgi:hypothetical protein